MFDSAATRSSGERTRTRTHTSIIISIVTARPLSPQEAIVLLVEC